MKLTTAEEQIMQIVWQLEKGTVREIMNEFIDKKPAYNTVSTLLKILEKKGFVDHKTYGNTYVFYPVVQKDTYVKKNLKKLMKDYFNNSFPAMASFLVKENDISVEEMEEILEQTKAEIKGTD
jgi:predicted transcriptional regulator